MPGSISVTPASLRFTILAIGNQKVSLRRAGVASVEAAGRRLKAIVRRNVTRRDHTMLQLAQMDHPYARRHGRIKIHTKDSGPFIVDGTSLVHTRSGALVASLKGGMRSGSSIAYDLSLDDSIPSVHAVLYGTNRMLPRDPLWHTAIAPGTVADMRKAIVATLGKSLRAQAVVRFTP